MADGTFAVLMAVLGLAEMSSDYCGRDGGCLAQAQVPARIMVSAGEVLERRATPQPEIYLRYDLPTQLGPFGVAAGISMAEAGETWVGVGNTYLIDFGGSAFYGELHAMPGLYFDRGGFDLGGTLEFRSGIELGVETRQGWRIGLSYDHRSNAGIYARNPGIETVALHVSVALE